MSLERPPVESDWRVVHDRIWATLDRLAQQNLEIERLIEKRARDEARREEKRARDEARREEKRAQEEARREEKRAQEEARREEKRAQEEARRAEVDRDLEEMRRRGKEHDRRLRGLDTLFNSQWGKLIESLVEGDLVKLLRSRGIEVVRTWRNAELVHDDWERELDIVAVNGSEVVVVEVKTTMKVRDVDYFLEILPRFKQLAPEYRNHTVYGAMAYLKADESSSKYAARKGLFVIRATGSSASITNDDRFRPRAFG